MPTPPISSLIRVEASSLAALGGKVLSRRVVSSTKWLELQSLTYSLVSDTKASSVSEHPRTWDFVGRTKRRTTAVADAVAVLATLRSEDCRNSDRRVLLTRQFRPPVGKICVELPAGLIDDGEGPGDAALRELREETGFTGKVVRMGRPQPLSPGLSDETIVTVEVDCYGESQAGQAVEEPESIEVVSVPLLHLREALDHMEREGCAVMHGLGSLATGVALGAKAAGWK